MRFSVLFGGVPLPNPEVIGIELGILSSSKILQSKRTAIRAASELHPSFRFHCRTETAGHFATIKGMIGGTYTLVIDEDPDLLALSGTYAGCTIVDLVPSQWGVSSMQYEIEIQQDTR
jgi:hypothetical protein